MEDRDPILNALANQPGQPGQPGRAVEDAVLAAIDLSSQPDQARLVEVLLDRGQPRGLAGVIARYHDFSHTLQNQLCDRANELAGGLGHCAVSETRQTRANAIALIAGGRWPALARHAATALADVDESLVNAAGEALAHCAQHFLAQPRPEQVGPDASLVARDRYAAWADQRDQLVAALGEAVATFQSHRRTAVLECAVQLCDVLTGVLRPMLEQPALPSTAALIEAVWQSPHLGAAAVPFHYLALSVPATRHRVASRVGMIRNRVLVLALIEQVGRAAAPEMAKGLAAIRQMSFMDQPGWWEQIPDALSEKLARWIELIGVDLTRKADWLVQLATDGSEPQRAVAVGLLCRLPGEQASNGLRRLAGLLDGDLSHRVTAELTRRGINVQELMRNHLGNPDPRVREAAREHVGRSAFDKFWVQYGKLTDEVRQFAADRLRRLVPDLAEQLAGRLADVKPAERLQALRVIGLCDIAGSLAEQILPCCQDNDPHVRSAAVKLLGQIPGPQSEQTVREALVDPDRRVRANAVEAIESQQSHSAVGDLTAMQDDRDNRIRANALKALMAMNFADARDNLQRMLADPSPDHRLSALWVVEQTGWLKPAMQVLQLAQRDGDRRIRCRALRTLSELRRVYQVGKGTAAGSQLPV